MIEMVPERWTGSAVQSIQGRRDKAEISWLMNPSFDRPTFLSKNPTESPSLVRGRFSPSSKRWCMISSVNRAAKAPASVAPFVYTRRPFHYWTARNCFSSCQSKLVNPTVSLDSWRSPLPSNSLGRMGCADEATRLHELCGAGLLKKMVSVLRSCHNRSTTQ
jgi:hypothetical protein